MRREEFNALGNKMKKFETLDDRRIMPGLPIIVRLDGRAFHTFTKGMERPYDKRMSMAMIQTTEFLVNETKASVGYTQSDEISLAFPNPDANKKMDFDGRIQKIASLFASLASVRFNELVRELMPEKSKARPIFDARVFAFPNLDLALEHFLWREADATRNSLTMAAHAYYDHKDLQHVGSAQKHELLFAKGINWNDYPAFFKRGTYVRREKVWKELSEKQLARIPENKRPTGPIQRSVVKAIDDMPILSQITNGKEVLFAGAIPVCEKQ